MKRHLKIHCHFALACIVMISTTFWSSNWVAAQRLERPPVRSLEGTPPIPGGRQSIPAGTVLVLEMETPLSSKSSHVSDRFRARVATPVIDEAGETVVPIGSIVDGRVSTVRPAKWRRRSGIIGISFERLRLRNGREYPIRGTLTSVRDGDRKRFDDERNLKGSSTTARDAFFVGGGAGTGAAIGAITGSALVGAGIGAAAGVTTALLMKGKDAVIEPGYRFGLELSQQIRLTSSGGYSSSPSYSSSTPYPIRVAPRPRLRTSTTPRSGTGSYGPTPDITPSDNGNGLNGVPVNVSDVRAERSGDGLIRILVTAETPTTGWRIFTNHVVSSNTVEVRLRGVPPSNNGVNQLSHPPAPTIRVPDRSGALNRVVVHAKNGTRDVAVNGSSSNSNYEYSGRVSPSTRGTAAPIRVPRSTSGGSTFPPAAVTASRVINQIERVRSDFAVSIGVLINQDGTYTPSGNRNPTVNERRMLDALGSLLTSTQAYESASNASERRNGAAKIREDANTLQQWWQQVRLSPELNQKFRAVIRDARSLAANEQSGSEQPPDVSDSNPNPTPARPQPTEQTGGASPSPDASRLAGFIVQLQYDYGTSVGVWINQDGTYDVIGQRRPSADQKQILDALSNLLVAVKTINSASTPSSRRDAAARIQEDVNLIERAKARVSMSQDLNQRFRKLVQDARALSNNIPQ